MLWIFFISGNEEAISLILVIRLYLFVDNGSARIITHEFGIMDVIRLDNSSEIL